VRKGDDMSSTIILERPDPSAPFEKPFPTLWAALGWVVGFIVLQIAVSVLFILPALDWTQSMDAVVAQMRDPNITALPSIRALVAANGLLIVLFALYIRKDGRAQKLGLTHWGKDGVQATLRIALLLIAAALIFNIGYTVLIGSKLEMQKALREMLAAIPQTGLNVATIMFATVLLAPVVEELVFRGMLQTSLLHGAKSVVGKLIAKGRLPKSMQDKLPIWLAIGVAAFVFSIMHGDLNSAPALMIIGAIFGTLYHLTGSLRVTIAAHLANNLFAMLASNFF
jgi:membrane protease YdiL (CAAX protease family)